MKVRPLVKLTYLLAGALVILITGCSNKKRESDQNAFFPDWRSSSVRKLSQTQAANGARNDGMLYPRHFDGANLSTLGKQKLSLMLGDDAAANPLTVYLVNVGQGDLLNKRKQSIRDYLKDGLRPDESVEFVMGMNPNTLHPSAETISRAAKAESGDMGPGGGAGGAGAAAPMIQIGK
jgi:hypothetical protein